MVLAESFYHAWPEYLSESGLALKSGKSKKKEEDKRTIALEKINLSI